MKNIAIEVFGSAKLILPNRRFRLQFAFLVLLAALIPVTELLVIKLFTDLVIDGGNMELSMLAFSILGVSALFVTTRVVNYIQKTYRVKFFDKSFEADDRERSSTKEAWEWAMALELVNVLSFITQILVIAGFFFVLNWEFAIIVLITALVVFEIFGRFFRRQQIIQRGFVEKKRSKQEVRPADRLGSRIQSAEFVTLLASIFTVILIAVLIFFGVTGITELSNTIVFFLGLRLLNTTYGSLAGSLMRFARAKANSF